MRVLFILKRREDYNEKIHTKVGLSTGLYNSASFCHNMLNAYNIKSKLIVVVDNNDIDREVKEYQPTHVIIEALWVVPEKFTVLSKLHPNVEWIIRLHSELPFLAGEGIALDWIGSYSLHKNIKIGVNAPRMMNEVIEYLKTKGSYNDNIIYMPNYYPQDYTYSKKKKDEYLDIGCFGAVRLLKNHMVQAMAAIKAANKMGKKLRFHVNIGRIEMQGGPVMHNLLALFEGIEGSGHTLINHPWVPREEFLKICAKMDVGMQCNFSETFNIVGADLISQGIPLVGSKEIPWLPRILRTDPTDSDKIASKLILAYKYNKILSKYSQVQLSCYTNKSRNHWINYFKETK